MCPIQLFKNNRSHMYCSTKKHCVCVVCCVCVCVCVWHRCPKKRLKIVPLIDHLTYAKDYSKPA